MLALNYYCVGRFFATTSYTEEHIVLVSHADKASYLLLHAWLERPTSLVLYSTTCKSSWSFTREIKNYDVTGRGGQLIFSLLHTTPTGTFCIPFPLSHESTPPQPG